MSYGDPSYGPWHTLTVSDAVWYCDTVSEDDPARCGPIEECQGHDRPHPGRMLEQDRQIDHPGDCPIPECCCKTSEELRQQFDLQTDPECADGRHDNCLNCGYRCYTETQVYEWWDVEEMPTAAGVYRLRVWGSGPDHNGEYDGGIDWEPVPDGE